MHALARHGSRLLALALFALCLWLCPRIFANSHPYRPPEPLPGRPLLDLHCHTAGLGAGGSGCFVSPAMASSPKLRFFLRSFGVTRSEVERAGDALVLTRLSQRLAASEHVNRAVVLALDGVIDRDGRLDRTLTELYIPDEFLAAEVAKHPNLLWGASVNPYRPDALARLDWAKAHGAVLVKWLPSIQQIDPADDRLKPFYEKLVALRLPLLTHTGDEHSFTRADNSVCDPERLRLPLRCGVTVIAAHAATTGRFHGERSVDRLARLLPEFPNLYADISSLTQINKARYLREVLRRPEFRGRLLYGTDYPLIEIRPLVATWYFGHRLTWRQLYTISRIDNPWDRDVALKQALGVPTDAWTRAETLLDLPPHPNLD